MTSAPKILLVDDDVGLVEVLTMALRDHGFVVASAHDGLAGLRAFEAERPNLVILDLGMPELDGFEVCRQLRRDHDVPILMLTSRDEELDEVLGLELGADDYVTKPFATRALVARLKALLRRRPSLEPDPSLVVPELNAQTRSHGNVVVDRGAWRVTCRGNLVAVTATELELLWALLAEPGKVLSREALIAAVYGPSVKVEARTIDTFVKRLRKKLRAEDPDFDHLETVRAVGYRYRVSS